MFSGSEMVTRIIWMAVLLPSLAIHEWAHAVSALLLGDDTAKRMGRCTPNPLAHIDLIGTLLLPLLGVPFGWAKPVPVNPRNFHQGINPRLGMMITALAGPISNVSLALLVAALLYGGKIIGFWTIHTELMFTVLTSVFYLNLVLAIFNLLPFPPLDGSRVADFFMPSLLRPVWNRIYTSGPIALILLFVLLRTTPLNIHVLPMRLTRLLLQALGVL